MKVLYVEGADCIGKTTLIKELVKELEDMKYRVLATREPDYCFRKALLNTNFNKKEFCYYAQKLMMGTSHIQKLDDLNKIKLSGDYDVVIVDRTSIISDYVYGSKLMLDMNFGVVQGALEPIIKEMNTELKEHSYLVIGRVSDEEFEKRISSRPSQQDALDTYENKLRVRSGYDAVISEILIDGGDFVNRLFANHFNDINIISFDDLRNAKEQIINNVLMLREV